MKHSMRLLFKNTRLRQIEQNRDCPFFKAAIKPPNLRHTKFAMKEPHGKCSNTINAKKL